MTPLLLMTPPTTPSTGNRTHGTLRRGQAESTFKTLQRSLEPVSAERGVMSAQRPLESMPCAMGHCPQPCVLAALLWGPACHLHLDLSSLIQASTGGSHPSMTPRVCWNPRSRFRRQLWGLQAGTPTAGWGGVSAECRRCLCVASWPWSPLHCAW